MRFPRKRGATSVKARVFIPDNTSVTGAGLTGLTNSSTNLAICYARENDNGATEVTGANILDISTVGTWADPGAGKVRFKAVDSTKLPGVYEIHFPDAAAFGAGDTSQNIIINVYEKATTALKIGPNMVMIPLSSLNVLDGESNLLSILGTTLTETSAGRIAAAVKKLFDVAAPVLTAESVNQGADNNTILANATYGPAALKALIDTLTGYVDTEITGITNTVTTILSRIVGTLAAGTHNPLTAAEIKSAMEAAESYLALIKAVTDKMHFNGDNLNANLKAINDTTLEGDGDAVPWGPA